MSRLIDADKLLRDIEKYHVSDGKFQHWMEIQPTIESEIIHCKDCKWWDRRDEQSSYGYCHAIKHSHYSRHWEISIYRTYDKDFFCADAERRTDESDKQTD